MNWGQMVLLIPQSTTRDAVGCRAESSSWLEFETLLNVSYQLNILCYLNKQTPAHESLVEQIGRRESLRTLLDRPYNRLRESGWLINFISRQRS
jgi:hypothetical protein